MATNHQSRDRKLVSSEPHEIEYIHRQFPNHSHLAVESAIAEAKRQLGGSEDRERILQHLRSILK